MGDAVGVPGLIFTKACLMPLVRNWEKQWSVLPLAFHMAWAEEFLHKTLSVSMNSLCPESETVSICGFR
jgi:hypothetical protein